MIACDLWEPFYNVCFKPLEALKLIMQEGKVEFSHIL